MAVRHFERSATQPRNLFFNLLYLIDLSPDLTSGRCFSRDDDFFIGTFQLYLFQEYDRIKKPVILWLPAFALSNVLLKLLIKNLIPMQFISELVDFGISTNIYIF